MGTSGWSYPEWVGSFYPAKTAGARMLGFYGRHFLTVEAHSTHRRAPTAAALQRWVEAVPPQFRFAPKAHAGITHRRDLDGVAERVRSFDQSLAPLGDRLGPVLFVLPHRQPDLTRLDLLLEALGPLPRLHPVFELAPGWWVDDVFDRLERHGASLAIVDRDGARVPEERWAVAGPLAYVRLRRQSYSDGELAGWAHRLAEAAATRSEGAYAFVKHDEKGNAPRYARALVEHLEGQ
ncbi:MAG: DUF72 domain-containing protein [Actinomycetota bacterium]|nr:DUF72 domain-containing protein [Actinomycetota bacterium]